MQPQGLQAHQEKLMPLIEVNVIKDVFTPEQKNEIITTLTNALVSIEGENMRPVTWCVIREVQSGDWGIAGNALTTADVRALAAGAGV
jgi:4-oxalocrotonate tautomerase